MTEFAGRQPETAFLSPSLVSHFDELQSIVDRHIRQTGLSANDMTPAQIVEFSRRLTRYISFECEVSNVLKAKMPLSFKDTGGFIVFEQDWKVTGSQDMSEGDTMSGSFSSCLVHVVPSLRAMLDSADSTMVSSDDISMTAGIVLEDAVFRPHGKYSKPFDFGTYKVVIPLIYGMKVSAGAER